MTHTANARSHDSSWIILRLSKGHGLHRSHKRPAPSLSGRVHSAHRGFLALAGVDNAIACDVEPLPRAA